jgi:hypothetical protein
MESQQEETFENLQEELIESAEVVAVEQEERPEKQNTKDALIEKLQEFSQEGYEVPSNSKLRRFSKKKLSGLLADKIQEKLRRQMCQSVNAPENADNATLMLKSLRMVHDIFANVVESGANLFLAPRGMKISNFANSMKEEPTSEAIDDCLLEISRENENILKYIESPYSRLALCWVGAAAQNTRRYCVKQNVKRMGPRTAHQATAMGSRDGRRPPDREKLYASPPPQPVQKTV